MAEELFKNEYELETREIHFCVQPTRTRICLSHAWNVGDDDKILLTLKQARQLRTWLDTVIP